MNITDKMTKDGFEEELIRITGLLLMALNLNRRQNVKELAKRFHTDGNSIEAAYDVLEDEYGLIYTTIIDDREDEYETDYDYDVVSRFETYTN